MKSSDFIPFYFLGSPVSRRELPALFTLALDGHPPGACLRQRIFRDKVPRVFDDIHFN